MTCSLVRSLLLIDITRRKIRDTTTRDLFRKYRMSCKRNLQLGNISCKGSLPAASRRHPITGRIHTFPGLGRWGALIKDRSGGKGEMSMTIRKSLSISTYHQTTWMRGNALLSAAIAIVPLTAVIPDHGSMLSTPACRALCHVHRTGQQHPGTRSVDLNEGFCMTFIPASTTATGQSVHTNIL